MKTIFLNSHRAKSGVLNGRKLPKNYVLACKFFDCGIIDRTKTLETGFEAKVLDPIPAFDAAFQLSFPEISRRVASDIAEKARREGRKIQLLWSGGIDSTVALVAFLETLPKAEWEERLEILLSMDSINEYPLFFHRFIHSQLPYTFICPPITNHFGAEALIVTGEHGDQLFGSDKLLPLIVNGLAGMDFRDAFPLYATHKFRKPEIGERLLDYLEPLIASAPTPLKTTFDLFWWLNFTIKWQQVTLRLPIFTFAPDISDLTSRFHHFFRDADFQQWSFHQHESRAVEKLTDYKGPAKAYLFSFTGDEAYHNSKSKEPSLKHVIVDRKSQGDKRYRVSMKTDYKPLVETFHRKYKNKNISE